MACLKARTANTGAGVSGGSMRVSSTVSRQNEVLISAESVVPSIASSDFWPEIQDSIIANDNPSAQINSAMCSHAVPCMIVENTRTND